MQTPAGAQGAADSVAAIVGRGSVRKQGAGLG
jgi:hypothetical protein